MADRKLLDQLAQEWQKCVAGRADRYLNIILINEKICLVLENRKAAKVMSPSNNVQE